MDRLDVAPLQRLASVEATSTSSTFGRSTLQTASSFVTTSIEQKFSIGRICKGASIVYQGDNMLDPTISLALSMYSTKGIYALLLGSGISRVAGIPTGWEVVLDLIRRIALLQGEDCEPDPAAWYTRSFGQEPSYSILLEALARSPSERQQLLRGYFEPTKAEREQGLKVSTLAHKAIAELVAKGYVRVILTTNFDHLLEQALEAVGVVPTVISTPEAVEGTLPLTHTQCTVIKLHGDYLDIRIKNTPLELERYDHRLDALLDRILDESASLSVGGQQNGILPCGQHSNDAKATASQHTGQ